MAGAGDRPAAAQPELRQRARRQEAFHPVGRELMSPEQRQARAPVPHRDVRAWPSEQARHREPVSAIPQPEACRDVRRAAVRPGVRSAACRVQHPEPALRSVPVLLSERAALRSEQPRRDEPQEQPVKATA